MRLIGSFLIALFFIADVLAQDIYSRSFVLMGSNFDITVIAEDAVEGEKYIDLAVGEIERIEKIISSWDPKSQTSNINRNAGIHAVKVSPELFDLISRSLEISKITDGAFDISYASMDRIWKFDGSMKRMPFEEAIKASISKVGYQNIALDRDNGTVFLARKGMKIGFGAIGKGYAADRAKDLLISKGVKAGIINASGDMNTWGRQLNGKQWTVAITNPLNKEKAFGTVPISEGAIVTSGNYEKYVVFDEERYSHIINPKTGYPCQGILSVTVLAPSAELADALATSIFVMGIGVGIDRVNQLSQIECIIVDEFGEIHQSKNIQIQVL